MGSVCRAAGARGGITGSVRRLPAIEQVQPKAVIGLLPGKAAIRRAGLSVRVIQRP